MGAFTAFVASPRSSERLVRCRQLYHFLLLSEKALLLPAVLCNLMCPIDERVEGTVTITGARECPVRCDDLAVSLVLPRFAQFLLIIFSD